MQAWPAATTSGLPIKITDWRDDVETPAELSSCEVVFITVSTSRDLIEVTTGANGLFTGERAPGPRVVVDCSTVSPEASATVRETSGLADAVPRPTRQPASAAPGAEPGRHAGVPQVVRAPRQWGCVLSSRECGLSSAGPHVGVRALGQLPSLSPVQHTSAPRGRVIPLTKNPHQRRWARHRARIPLATVLELTSITALARATPARSGPRLRLRQEQLTPGARLLLPLPCLGVLHEIRKNDVLPPKVDRFGRSRRDVVHHCEERDQPRPAQRLLPQRCWGSTIGPSWPTWPAPSCDALTRPRTTARSIRPPEV